MRILDRYKRIISLSTVFLTVFGLFVVCCGCFAEPIFVASADDGFDSMIVGGGDACRAGRISTNHYLVDSYKGSVDGYMSCCYEKSQSDSDVRIETDFLLRLFSQSLLSIEFEGKNPTTPLRLFFHGPPISAADLSSIIVKRE